MPLLPHLMIPLLLHLRALQLLQSQHAALSEVPWLEPSNGQSKSRDSHGTYGGWPTDSQAPQSMSVKQCFRRSKRWPERADYQAATGSSWSPLPLRVAGGPWGAPGSPLKMLAWSWKNS